MDMPQLTDGHKKLETIAGTWTGDEHMQPSQWVPEPMTAQGKSVCKLILNGFAVSMDYVQSCGGQEMFSGHGVYTYNGKDDSYLLHWFDSMGAGCEVFSGGFDGDTLVMTSKGFMGYMRMTSDYSGGQLASRMEMSQDGEDWTLMFRGTYSKE
ncbi:MAG: hypothetical protein CMJ83_15585 [Planctomycetes bacterium]|nr:hypothetical protein [Planctomycetota bacterium]